MPSAPTTLTGVLESWKLPKPMICIAFERGTYPRSFIFPEVMPYKYNPEQIATGL
jgi:hypothetical protein